MGDTLYKICTEAAFDLAIRLSVETLPLGQDGSHRLPSGVVA